MKEGDNVADRILWGAGAAKFQMPEYKWQWRFVGNPGWTCLMVDGPNWFHRKMQRLILGIEWERISE